MSALNQLPQEYRVNIEAIAAEPDREAIAEMVLEMEEEIKKIVINSDWIRFRCLIDIGVRYPTWCRYLRSNNPAQINVALGCVGLTTDQLDSLFDGMPVFIMDGTQGIWVNREPPSV